MLQCIAQTHAAKLKADNEVAVGSYFTALQKLIAFCIPRSAAFMVCRSLCFNQLERRILHSQVPAPSEEYLMFPFEITLGSWSRIVDIVCNYCSRLSQPRRPPGTTAGFLLLLIIFEVILFQFNFSEKRMCPKPTQEFCRRHSSVESSHRRSRPGRLSSCTLKKPATYALVRCDCSVSDATRVENATTHLRSKASIPLEPPTRLTVSAHSISFL